MAQTRGELLTGAAGSQTLRGGSAMDVLSGADGADLLLGLDGSDGLDGGAGADRLRGGDGDDLLFMDRADVLVDGGDGIDTAILAPGDLPYVLEAGTVRGVEGVQDTPGADTTLILDAASLRGLDDDVMLFSLGDGIDEVRIVEFGSDPVSVDGDQVVFDGRVVLRFEGVESLTLSGGADGSSSVVSQTLTPDSASSTTLRTFSSGGGTTTTTTATNIATDTALPADEAPLTAAQQAAERWVSDQGLGESLFAILADYAEEAEARRSEDALGANAPPGNSLFANQELLDADEIFGLLSRDILAGLDQPELG